MTDKGLQSQLVLVHIARLQHRECRQQLAWADVETSDVVSFHCFCSVLQIGVLTDVVVHQVTVFPGGS